MCLTFVLYEFENEMEYWDMPTKFKNIMGKWDLFLIKTLIELI